MASEYSGVDSDLRNLYRRGSGLTPRRLLVLLGELSDNAPVRVAVREAAAEAQKIKPDLIRDRQADFEARNRRAREAMDG